MITMICAQCGSDEVQERLWVYVNNGKLAGDATGDKEDQWCPICNEHVDIIPKPDN